MTAIVNGRTFDRVPRWDVLNENFLVRDTIPAPKPIPKSVTRTRCTWLNQGNEGGCTGFSEATALSFAPHSNRSIVNGNGEFFYALAKQYDEYAGVNYEGSSVLGAMAGGVARGYIKTYSWATTVDEVIRAIAFNGVGVFGINWYNDMFNVLPGGIIKPGGTLAGGHAITASAIKNGGDLIRLDNTWGKTWGVNGSAWIAASDVDRLLGEQGEFATFVKAYPLPTIPVSGRVDPESNGGGVTGS